MTASYIRNGGKSRNAYEAEARGCYPISDAKRALAKGLGITQAKAKAILESTHSGEYHHTGLYANETNYYDVKALLDEIEEAGGLEAWLASEDGEDARKALAEPNAGRPAEQRFENCRVEWLEWSGSRKHPASTQRIAGSCTVVLRGQTFHITLPNGTALTKRIGCRGLYITGPDHDRIH